jgi:hypothetical protein
MDDESASERLTTEGKADLRAELNRGRGIIRNIAIGYVVMLAALVVVFSAPMALIGAYAVIGAVAVGASAARIRQLEGATKPYLD